MGSSQSGRVRLPIRRMVESSSAFLGRYSPWFMARKQVEAPRVNAGAILALPESTRGESPQRVSFGSFYWEQRATTAELARLSRQVDPSGWLLRLRSAQDPDTIVSGFRVFGLRDERSCELLSNSVAQAGELLAYGVRELHVLDSLGQIVTERGSLPIRVLSYAKEGQIFFARDLFREVEALRESLELVAREYCSFFEARRQAKEVRWIISETKLSLLKRSRLYVAPTDEESDISLGKYRGRQIITRETPILGGVLFPFNTDNPITVPHHSPMLQALTDEIEAQLSRLSSQSGVDSEYQLLQILSRLVQQQLHNRSSQGLRALHELNRINKGEEVSLDLYLRASASDPHILALTAGAVLELLKQKQSLNLTSAITFHHCQIDRTSHSFIRFRGTFSEYILDPWNDYVGVVSDFLFDRFPYCAVEDFERLRTPRAF